MDLHEAILDCLDIFVESQQEIQHCNIDLGATDRIEVKKLHLHPEALSGDYSRLQEKLYNVLPINMKCNVLNKKDASKILNDDDINFMLRACGRYNLLLNLAKRAHQTELHYTDYIVASEQDHKLLDTDQYNVYLGHFRFILSYVIGPNKTSQFDEIIFKNFVYYFMSVTVLSTIHCQPRKIHKCSDYRRNGFCIGCVHQDIMDECCLGYIMLYCSDIIKNILHNTPMSKLKKIINECYAANTIRPNDKMGNLLIKFKLLKRWNIAQFGQTGQDYIFSAFNYFMKMRCKHKGELHLDKRPKLCHIVASAFFTVKGQHRNSTIFHVLAVVSQGDLYDRVMCMRELSYHCFVYKEY